MKDFGLKRRWMKMAEAFLIGFVIFIFCLSALQSLFLLAETKISILPYHSPHGDEGFLFFSIVTMIIAGLGIIALLLLKLWRLKGVYAQKQLLKQQFFQAQKMEALGRLAGGVAHDFNNILASMMGYTEFLLDDLEKGTEQYGFARQIERGGQQARALVDQILAFARQRDRVKGPVDMVEVVRETHSMLRSTLPATISTKVDIPVSEAFIHANPSQIGQVLMNVCVNAADAMGDEHGRLSISLAVREAGDFPYDLMLSDSLSREKSFLSTVIQSREDGGHLLLMGNIVRGQRYVQIEIADTGCGLSQLIMEHMFDPFYTMNKGGKGTGLGLSSVHGIIATHQGALTVSSKEGEGAVFDLYFPLMEGMGSVEFQPDQEEPVSVTDVAAYFILVVEDNDDVRDMLIRMIARCGYQVEGCSSACDAIDHLRENPERYHLVITDYIMPDMTGAELVEEIGHDFPELPLLLITGYSRKELEELRKSNPSVRMLLRKPIEGSVLQRALADILGVERGGPDGVRILKNTKDAAA